MMTYVEVHVCYLFQQVFHLPLPALSRRHHLQVFLLGDLSQRCLFVCLILLVQLLLQQSYFFPVGKTSRVWLHYILLHLRPILFPFVLLNYICKYCTPL